MLSSQTSPSSQPIAVDGKVYLLRVQHDDLDAAIAALLLSGLGDDLLVTRLKKRKLQIRDEITALLATQNEPVAQAS